MRNYRRDLPGGQMAFAEGDSRIILAPDLLCKCELHIPWLPRVILMLSRAWEEAKLHPFLPFAARYLVHLKLINCLFELLAANLSQLRIEQRHHDRNEGDNEDIE